MRAERQRGCAECTSTVFSRFACSPCALADLPVLVSAVSLLGAAAAGSKDSAAAAEALDALCPGESSSEEDTSGAWRRVCVGSLGVLAYVRPEQQLSPSLPPACWRSPPCSVHCLPAFACRRGLRRPPHADGGGGARAIRSDAARRGGGGAAEEQQAAAAAAAAAARQAVGRLQGAAWQEQARGAPTAADHWGRRGEPTGRCGQPPGCFCCCRCGSGGGSSCVCSCSLSHCAAPRFHCCACCCPA